MKTVKKLKSTSSSLKKLEKSELAKITGGNEPGYCPTLTTQRTGDDNGTWVDDSPC